jgi:hypothetical protein
MYQKRRQSRSLSAYIVCFLFFFQVTATVGKLPTDERVTCPTLWCGEKKKGRVKQLLKKKNDSLFSFFHQLKNTQPNLHLRNLILFLPNNYFTAFNTHHPHMF